MPKSSKQIRYEKIIIDLFMNKITDKSLIVKALLNEYNPPAPASSSLTATTTNFLYKTSYALRHHSTVANKMLEIIQENPSNAEIAIESLNVPRQNNAKAINPEGDFVALWNAYFSFFPEDRHLINESSVFHAVLTTKSYADQYADEIISQFTADPVNTMLDLHEDALE